MDNYKGIRIGNVIRFEGGYIAENRAFDNSGKAIQKFDDVSGRGHLENFIESIQTGKQLYTSKVHHGHWSAALGHMANTSYIELEKLQIRKISRTQLVRTRIFLIPSTDETNILTPMV